MKVGLETLFSSSIAEGDAAKALAPSDRRAFSDHLTLVNLSRLRILAAFLAVVEAGMLAIVWTSGARFYRQAPEALPPWLIGSLQGTRASLVALGVLALVVLRRPASAADVGPRHRRSVMLFLLPFVVLLSVQTALQQFVSPDVTVYLMTIFVVAAALRFPPLRAALVFGLALATLHGGALAFGVPDPGRQSYFSSTAGALFAFLIGLVFYRGAARSFARERFIDAQSEQLRTSEAKYRALVDNAPVAIFRTTARGEVLAANPAMLGMLKFRSLEEVNESGLLSLYADPEDGARLIEGGRRL